MFSFLGEGKVDEEDDQDEILSTSSFTFSNINDNTTREGTDTASVVSVHVVTDDDVIIAENADGDATIQTQAAPKEEYCVGGGGGAPQDQQSQLRQRIREVRSNASFTDDEKRHKVQRIMSGDSIASQMSLGGLLSRQGSPTNLDCWGGCPNESSYSSSPPTSKTAAGSFVVSSPYTDGGGYVIIQKTFIVLHRHSSSPSASPAGVSSPTKKTTTAVTAAAATVDDAILLSRVMNELSFKDESPREQPRRGQCASKEEVEEAGSFFPIHNEPSNGSFASASPSGVAAVASSGTMAHIFTTAAPLSTTLPTRGLFGASNSSSPSAAEAATCSATPFPLWSSSRDGKDFDTPSPAAFQLCFRTVTSQTKLPSVPTLPLDVDALGGKEEGWGEGHENEEDGDEEEERQQQNRQQVPLSGPSSSPSCSSSNHAIPSTAAITTTTSTAASSALMPLRRGSRSASNGGIMLMTIHEEEDEVLDNDDDDDKAGTMKKGGVVSRLVRFQGEEEEEGKTDENSRTTTASISSNELGRGGEQEEEEQGEEEEEEEEEDMSVFMQVGEGEFLDSDDDDDDKCHHQQSSSALSSLSPLNTSFTVMPVPAATYGRRSSSSTHEEEQEVEDIAEWERSIPPAVTVMACCDPRGSGRTSTGVGIDGGLRTATMTIIPPHHCTMDLAFLPRGIRNLREQGAGGGGGAAASACGGGHSSTSGYGSGAILEECKHYKKKCSRFFFACCNAIDCCHRCHMERHGCDVRPPRITSIVCDFCDMRQSPGAACQNPDCPSGGSLFSEAYCGKCLVWTTAPIAHCDKCGTCRVGNAEDLYHCDTCDACFLKQHRHRHRCVKSSLKDQHCPLCLECVHFSQKRCDVLSCGHVAHFDCLARYLSHESRSAKMTPPTCPTCRKCLLSPSAAQPYWDSIRAAIAQQPLPADWFPPIGVGDLVTSPSGQPFLVTRVFVGDSRTPAASSPRRVGLSASYPGFFIGGGYSSPRTMGLSASYPGYVIGGSSSPRTMGGLSASYAGYVNGGGIGSVGGDAAVIAYADSGGAAIIDASTPRSRSGPYDDLRSRSDSIVDLLRSRSDSATLRSRSGDSATPRDSVLYEGILLFESSSLLGRTGTGDDTITPETEVSGMVAVFSLEDLTSCYKVDYICNDCEAKGKTNFHFIGLECVVCGGFNTSRL